MGNHDNTLSELNSMLFKLAELWGMYDPLSIDAQLDEAVKLLTQSS